MSDRFTFALWMQSEREKRGWSQSDLSRYSGLHRAIISKIETNVSTPSIETFISLAQAFKISPITIIRKAGLLPDENENTNFEDWRHLLTQLTPDEEEEMRQIIELKIERRQKANKSTRAEVLALASVSVETLHEARAQAGAALLFLSGMRADTLASLPMQCIDLPNLRIYQIPSMGVRTKNNKAAITYLLNVPELLDVVRAWDNRLRQRSFAPNALWYAPLNHDGMEIYETSRAIQARHGIIRDDIEMLCKKLGVSYASPHKFRHGHIVYARSFASNMEEVKAISQNVMHANTIITDQIYSGLAADKVQSVITNLGAHAPQNQNPNIAEILLLLEKLKDQLR